MIIKLNPVMSWNSKEVFFKGVPLPSENFGLTVNPNEFTWVNANTTLTIY